MDVPIRQVSTNRTFDTILLFNNVVMSYRHCSWTLAQTDVFFIQSRLICIGGKNIILY